MTSQRQIEDILLQHILLEYAENSVSARQVSARQLIRQVCSKISDVQTVAFLQIYRQISSATPQGSIRTRRVLRTSTEPVGIAFYDSLIVKNRSHEVLFCGFPSKRELQSLELYLSGVESDSSNFSAPLPDGSLRFGVPVRRAIIQVTRTDVDRIAAWAVQMWRRGFARATS